MCEFLRWALDQVPLHGPMKRTLPSLTLESSNSKLASSKPWCPEIIFRERERDGRGWPAAPRCPAAGVVVVWAPCLPAAAAYVHACTCIWTRGQDACMHACARARPLHAWRHGALRRNAPKARPHSRTNERVGARGARARTHSS